MDALRASIAVRAKHELADNLASSAVGRSRVAAITLRVGDEAGWS